jgi:epoxyqueuosine reductase
MEHYALGVGAPKDGSALRSGVAREETPRPGVRRHVPARAEGSLTPTSPLELTRSLLAEALDLGCAAVGVFPVAPFEDAGERLAAWLAAGHHGTMSYLSEGPRSDPRALLPEAESGLLVAVPYGGVPEDETPSPPPNGPRGRIARYARGNDYHPALHGLLLRLADAAAQRLGRPVLARVCVDTAPLLEREAARRAGLAFFGKNTLAIVPGLGSYVLLGEVLWDVPLVAGERLVRGRRAPAPALDGCGSCTACLDVCPTNAFRGPHQLDARLCLSYLTIESAGVIPEALREPIGDHVFGCDLCQDVCPYNRAAPKRLPSSPLGTHEHLKAPDLVELLELGSAGYRRFVRGTALRRVNRERLARNAAVALGNVGGEAELAPLSRALRQHPSPLVRGHAAWALGRLLSRLTLGRSTPLVGMDSAPTQARRGDAEAAVGAALEALSAACAGDADPWVREEADRARHALAEPARRLPLVSGQAPPL